jgi:hypothetical protein
VNAAGGDWRAESLAIRVMKRRMTSRETSAHAFVVTEGFWDPITTNARLLRT